MDNLLIAVIGGFALTIWAVVSHGQALSENFDKVLDELKGIHRELDDIEKAINRVKLKE